MLGRNSSIVVALAAHFFMGVSLGLAFLIVLIASNINNVADLLSSPVDPSSAAVTVSMYVAVTFGGGAAITGAVFEVTQKMSG